MDRERSVKEMGKVLPILFNTEMVRVVLDGRKTATRRAVRYKYENTEMKMRTDKYGTRLIEIQKNVEGETHGRNPDGRTWQKLLPYIEKNPPWKKGDILYVRETWQYLYELDGNDQIIEGTGRYYYAAIDELPFDTYVDPAGIEHQSVPWRPSIHMPKEAARIWLKVTDVRVERLQDITEEQAEAEGLYKGWRLTKTSSFASTAKQAFMWVWDMTIKTKQISLYGWIANPWVWVIEFERCEKPEPCIIKGVRPAQDERPCIGYGVSEDDDEPCEMCKGCKVCSGND